MRLSSDQMLRFRQRVLPYLDDAYRFARSLAREETAAQDIVQDAFLRAIRGFEGCRGNEKPWLFTIVRNCYRDWIRTKGPKPASFEDDSPPDVLTSESTESQLIRVEDIANVRDAVGALPEPFREAIVLREFEELTYREISTITGAPIGTVMSRLARGRAMLAASLCPPNSKVTTR
jgi:RNA polymerase sigma factor (sigma-70 family)